MPSKFSYRKREFKDLKDVQVALEELAYQAEKEFRASEKTVITAEQVKDALSKFGLIQSTFTPSSRASVIQIDEGVVGYRAGLSSVSAGTNTITFTSPLPSSSYVVLWALLNSSNELSSATPDPTSFSGAGFNIVCLEAGVLHWKVELPK